MAGSPSSSAVLAPSAPSEPLARPAPRLDERRGFRYRHAVGLFVLAWSAYFAPVLFRGEILLPFDFVYRVDPVYQAATPPDLPLEPENLMMGWDRVFQFHPWHEFNVRALRGGELPLWNPYSAAGTPHLALDQTGVFDPLSTGAGLLVGPRRANTAQALLSVLLIGLGSLLLCRRLRISPAGGLMCALALGFGAWMVLWIGRPISAAACWIPWILWALDRLLRERTPARDALLVASFVALSFAAGHVETTAHALLLGGAFSLAFVGMDRTRSVSHRARRAGAGVAALLAGAVVASVVLLPLGSFLFGEAGGPGIRAADALSTSERLLRGLAGELDALRALGTLASAVIPVANVAGSAPFTVPGPNLAENSIYIGVVPLLLAAYALAYERRSKQHWFWAAIAVLALLVALRFPLVNLINQLPLVRITAVDRFRLVYAIGAAVLAAYGLGAIQARPPRRSWRPLLLLPLFAAGALLTTHLLDGAGADSLRRGLIGWAAGVGFLALLAGAPRRWLVPSMLTLAAVELSVALWGVQPSFRADTVYPATATTEFLQQRPDDRIAAFPVDGRRPLLGAAHLAHGLSSIEGYNVLFSDRYRRLMGLVNRGAPLPSPYSADYLVLDHPGSPLVDLLGVRYLVTAARGSQQLAHQAGIPEQFPRLAFADATAAVWENPDPMPGAWLVGRVVPASGPGEAERLVGSREVDFRRVAVVELPPGTPPMPVASVTGGTVREGARRLTRRTLQVFAPAGGLLVLNEAYDRGWRVQIDGSRADILPTNLAFMGIPVPAGAHEVTLEYAPASFLVGLALSAAALLTLLGLAVAEHHRLSRR